jgi:hypothetical protein
MCTAIADGSIEKYPFGAKHAIIAMVKAQERNAQDCICKLLSAYGWSRPEITRIRLLEEPFESDDADILACHRGAMEKDGGIIIYSDPICDDEPES